MRGAGEHCKENNAALCKCNCAAGQAGPIYMWASLWTDNRTIPLGYPVNKVDREIIIGVITFTPVSVRSPGHTHAKTHVHRPQNGSPAPIWNTQPTPGRRDRRAFQSQRVLRCAGCGSGQVRDAASCRERRPSDYRSGLGVWLLARPSFYQAQLAFEQDGIAGLVPHKRGPKQAHKLTSKIIVEWDQRNREALRKDFSIPR